MQRIPLNQGVLKGKSHLIRVSLKEKLSVQQCFMVKTATLVSNSSVFLFMVSGDFVGLRSHVHLNLMLFSCA